MNKKSKETKQNMSRRDFIKVTSVISLAAAVSRTGFLRASGSDKIQVGLIGCGGRGTGTAIDCINSSPNVVITAMGDIFQDRWESTLGRLKEELNKETLAITPDSCFSGFEEQNSAHPPIIEEETSLFMHNALLHLGSSSRNF